MRRRRILIAVVAWVAAIVFTRGAVALPEHCPPVTAEAVRRAAATAVAWFDANQFPDGRWVYQYDRDRDHVDTRTHHVRHSGVTMSLYQAHAAGIEGALRLADRGARWSFGEFIRSGDMAAIGDRFRVPTGASALLTAGLAIRKLETGDERFDEEMTAMGRFLVAMTEPSGAVLAEWDPDREAPVPGLYSKYFTGETFWALTLLAAVDPDPAWRDAAVRIGRYLTGRDQTEDLFPPTPDHWSAYGLNELAHDQRAALGPPEIRYARRLAGLFGVSVRFESQRTERGVNQLLRGGRTSGSGLGTLGEGLGSLWRLAGTEPALADMRDVIGERMACVAGLIVDRQAEAPAGASDERSDHVTGAWFRDGMTRMDDQQHSLSALLLSLPVLDDRAAQGATSGDDSAGRIVLLALIGLASVNPLRVRRLAGSVAPARVAVGEASAAAVLVVVAAVAAPLLRGIDVSPPTMLIAAGFLVAATAVADAVRLPAEPLRAEGWPAAVVPLLFPGLLRPATAALVLATAADIGIGAGIVVAILAAAGSAGALWPAESPPAALERFAARLPAAVAVIGAVDLVVDGVYAV